jgi:hypothetical protein
MSLVLYCGMVALELCSSSEDHMRNDFSRHLAASCLRTLFAFSTLLLCVSSTNAAELDGAWASDPDACSKIFVKAGAKLSIASNADSFGSGFIIEGDNIKGKFANCRIKARRQDGAVTYLLAECATDIALSENQFSFRLDNDHELTRFFPGMPGIESKYFRCKF